MHVFQFCVAEMSIVGFILFISISVLLDFTQVCNSKLHNIRLHWASWDIYTSERHRTLRQSVWIWIVPPVACFLCSILTSCYRLVGFALKLIINCRFRSHPFKEKSSFSSRQTHRNVIQIVVSSFSFYQMRRGYSSSSSDQDWSKDGLQEKTLLQLLFRV